MSKSQNGNKEAKKPKQAKPAHLPNPPGLPAGLAPLASSNPTKPRR